MRRRWAAAGDKSRGGAALSSPEFGVSGVPGVALSRVLSWNDHRDMRDPPRASAGLGDGRSGVCGTGGSSTWRRSLACTRSSIAVLRTG